MKDKEIKWQFADGYYSKVLIPKISRIDFYLSQEDYVPAYRELKQIFAQIANPIQEYDKRQAKKEGHQLIYETLTSLKTDIEKNQKEMNLLQLRRMNRQLMVKMTILRSNIDISIYAFYEQIMKTMDLLNMLFPKQGIDNRKDIYK